MRNKLIFFLSTFVCVSCTTTKDSTAEKVGLDKEQLRAIINERAPQIQRCYEHAIDERPGAMGKVVVHFDVDSFGAVKDMQFPEIDPSLESIKPCLTDEFAKMRFPLANDRVPYDIRYPFFFDERIHGRTNDRAIKNLGAPHATPAP